MLRLGVLRDLDYGLAAGGVVFDPVTLTAASMGATAVGGALSASGTLAGGDYAKSAADLRAAQLRMNAGQAIGSSQRQMLDTQDRTRLLLSTNRARAAASGVDAGVGAPAENAGAIAQRGSYHALMDLFNGESVASGYENEARGAEFEGDARKDASRLAAAGTIAGTAGSMFASYGRFAYPTTRGAGGVTLPG